MYTRELQLSHVLQIDKNEWETFLSEFSALAKNYELILNKLELAHTQMKELNQRNEALTQELRQAPSHNHAIMGSEVKREPDNLKKAEQTVQSKPGIFQTFRNRLELSKRKPQNLISGYASCRRCGFLIRKASRFCVGCGSDFGSVVCPCGRALSADDKFCDQCGRAAGLA